MYLRSGNFKGGLRDRVSVNSSEESVSNLYRTLTPILEEEYVSNTTSSMSLDVRVFPMAGVILLNSLAFSNKG